MPIFIVASALVNGLLVLNFQPAGDAESSAPVTWNEFYSQAARRYELTRAADDNVVPINDKAIFEWTSIDDYHGAVFAWCEEGRPILVGTVFSFPLSGSDQRLAVHEFASFAAPEVELSGPDDIQWAPPPVGEFERVPDAAPPPDSANLLRIQCRRLAKGFSAQLNRRGDIWELRLLPTPLLEYAKVSDEVLGGGLFAFVGYSTDPEILLLVEARNTDDGPAWFCHPVRFSDKSLYLDYEQKRVWESLRTAHGGEGPDSDDPNYRVLSSERIPVDLSERLSATSAEE